MLRSARMSSLVPFQPPRHHETIVRRPITTHHDERLMLAGLIDPAARDWIDSVWRKSSRTRPKHRVHDEDAPVGR